MSSERSALLVIHTGRSEALAHAGRLAAELRQAGFALRTLASECDDETVPGTEPVKDAEAADGVELVVALGGDGTLLRAARLARPAGVPLLGVNVGHVGFLAEAEAHHLPEVATRIAERTYTIEERLTLSAELTGPALDGAVWRDWALNEVSVERASRERLLEVLVSVDGEPVSRWGCDGVLVASPTGSTAYAFSAGGPVLWPRVEALVVVAISAHALFQRPLVLAPDSVVRIEAQPRSSTVVTCDGRPGRELGQGARITIERSPLPLRLARLGRGSFTDRLVSKFGLEVGGWRHRPRTEQ
jgi:NAD+ kinase